MKRVKIHPIFIPHQGCPFECVFCNQKILTGSSAAPSLDQVRAQLDRQLPDRGAGEIAFFGGSFTWLEAGQQQAYLELASEFVVRGRAAGIRLSTRPDGLGAHRISLLLHYPVTTVEVGCQSFSDIVLAASGRGHGVDEMLSGLARLRDSGLTFGIQLLPGLPLESSRGALVSLRKALDQRPAFLRIYPALVLPGTRLADQVREGSYRPLDLESAVDLTARMLVLCEARQVPVIRIGVQGDPLWHSDLGQAPKGPYHPAFGQLAKSRVWQWLLESACSSGSTAQVAVAPQDLSDCLGHRRQNLNALLSRGMPVTIQPDRTLLVGQYRVGARVYERASTVKNLEKELDHVVGG